MENSLIVTLTVIGMFALRFAIPVAVTLTICYFLRCLDAKWHPTKT